MLRKRTVAERQEALSRQSTEPAGVIPVAMARGMYEASGGVLHPCTISRYCRTRIHEFPRVASRMNATVAYEPIYGKNDVRASLVQDLTSYFRSGSESVHYSISPPLREEVDSVVREAKRKRNEGYPVFVVMEESAALVEPVRMERGECCIWDEVRVADGEASPRLIGGRPGERFVTAWATTDGEWPEIPDEELALNVVLGVVRAEQDTSEPIRKVLDMSCFVTEDDRYVSTQTSSVSMRLEAAPTMDEDVFAEKAARLRDAIGKLEVDAQGARIALLLKSMYVEDYADDAFRRLQYLRLWQSLCEAGRQLGYQGKIKYDHKIIAGSRTLAELRAHRDDIAHWWTDRSDEGYVTDLGATVNALLRAKYHGE